MDQRAAWNQKAEFWDALHGDLGNRFHRELVSPSVERLLDVQPGERILDVACGSGVLARRLAERGASVTAVDFSEALIKLAKSRGQPSGALIDYQVVDASADGALLKLGTFQGITCTMALMDMAEVGPLFRAVTRLLAPDGRFVFATAHPAFNSNNPIFVAEMADIDGVLTTTHFVKIAGYLDVPPVLAAGAPGEPAPHMYYHRPLHELLGEAFAAGLVMDGIEEPAFPQDADSQGRLTWYNFPQIPPVMTCRLRVAQ
jgi:2-polyprenyl-3-methyl-5-hydroxy-6-metoxy-1,4-benzoquinol methylase